MYILIINFDFRAWVTLKIWWNWTIWRNQHSFITSEYDSKRIRYTREWDQFWWLLIRSSSSRSILLRLWTVTSRAELAISRPMFTKLQVRILEHHCYWVHATFCLLLDNAYRDMLSDVFNQSVIISGESGAGKTECTKLILQVTVQHISWAIVFIQKICRTQLRPTW